MNMKIKKVYVHIGVPKSGSSSLQQSLLKSRERLVDLEGGFLYPKISNFHHGRLIAYMFAGLTPIPRVYLNRFNGNKEEYAQYIIKEQERFEDEVNHSDCENLIISGEQISRLKFDEIKKFKAYLQELAPHADIWIVACTREHTSWLASSVQQNVKVGKTVDMTKRIRKESSLYQRRLSDFIKVFGHEKMIVYKFEELKKYKNGPIGMLFSNIGVNTEGADLLNIKSNEGYSDVVVDIASYINTRLPLIKNHSLTKGRGFYDVRRLGRLSGKKYMLTEEIIKTMHAESMADKIWLLDHFGIDYTGVYSKKYVNEVVFGPSYVDEFKCIFVKLKPVIQKLSYDYINEKTLTPSVDEETKSKCKALVPWMDGITCDFKEQNLGYFIENLGGTYKISGTMKIRSSLFFHHVYYKRYGFKKTAKRLTERIFG